MALPVLFCPYFANRFKSIFLPVSPTMSADPKDVKLNADYKKGIANVARKSGIPLLESKARMPRAAKYLGSYSPTANDGD